MAGSCRMFAMALLLTLLALALCSQPRYVAAGQPQQQQLDPEMERQIKEKLKDMPSVPKGQDPAKIPADVFDAILDDDLALVQAIMHHGGDINEIGRGGQTPLLHAVMHGKDKAVAWLLEKGADRSIPEENGWTAMHAAAFAGKPAVVKVLLEHAVSPNDRLKDGLMPIHRACWGKDPEHTEVVRLLLKAGVPHDAPTAGGHRPLQLAEKHNPGTAKLLRKWAKKAAKADAPKAEL